MHILIVEDDQSIRETLNMFLEHELKADTRFAVKSSEAIESVQAFRPDIVLLDYLLEDGPAEPFLDYCERQEGNCPPIVIISAASNIESLATRRRKVVSIIKKPFDLDFLISEIKRLCE